MEPNKKTGLYNSMIISYIKGNFIKSDIQSQKLYKSGYSWSETL
jgi:hypothetical protein